MKDPDSIPFNRPVVSGAEEQYLHEVMLRGKFAAGGLFAKGCNRWLEEHLRVAAALTTTSGTAALEMAALLCDLEPGDEVILPSYAFSSTATAFVRCGAVLVFVDVDPSTMNVDPRAVEAAITSKARVIVALHYGGVACDMDSLGELAQEYGLLLVEDAAQAIFAEYRGSPCGSLGDFGCLSFHESKNLHCGEGGALLIKSPEHVERAEIIWEKGTDRAKFFRGEIDKYTWRDIGSSYVLSELNAAFLLAQLERGREITANRLAIWREYATGLEPLADRGLIQVPHVPEPCLHNGHIFWIKTRDAGEQRELIEFLRKESIHSVFHYVPLHTAPAGRRYGRFAGRDRFTTKEASRLVRLPLFYGFSSTERVANAVRSFYGVT